VSRQAREHDPAHLDGVLLYALQRLPASERAVVDAQLAACAQCREELQALRPIVTSVADVLRPPASLWNRLAQRIGAETGTAPMRAAAAPPIEPEWKDVAPGISCKLLATDTENDRVSMLVRLAPGTDYPSHRHAGVEELHLLHGELMIEDRKLYPGDYNRAEPGTVDRRVWSETGCTCVLITSTGDVIL
jgi:anti-sigma factor ChrR (cupin superfamily)